MSTYVMWHGANAVGHRHFITILPLLVVMAAAARPTLGPVGRAVFHAGIVCGILANVLYLLVSVAALAPNAWLEKADTHASLVELSLQWADRVSEGTAGLEAFLSFRWMLAMKVAAGAALALVAGGLMLRARSKLERDTA
jgi:hypothetical protein